MRKLFIILYYLVGKNFPNLFFSNRMGRIIRRECARRFLPSCGKNINIDRGATFSTRCIIGDNSGIGENARLGLVYIGNNVMMAPECVILSQNHKFDQIDKPMRLQGSTNQEAVIIEDDVWIGHRVIILPGLRIGKGSIIGAGSVVTKDVGEYDIVAGNPARIIRNRKG